MNSPVGLTIMPVLTIQPYLTLLYLGVPYSKGWMKWITFAKELNGLGVYRRNKYVYNGFIHNKVTRNNSKF